MVAQCRDVLGGITEDTGPPTVRNVWVHPVRVFVPSWSISRAVECSQRGLLCAIVLGGAVIRRGAVTTTL